MDASPEPTLLRSDMDGVVRLTLNRPQATTACPSSCWAGSPTSSTGSPRIAAPGGRAGRRRQGVLRRPRPQGDARPTCATSLAARAVRRVLPQVMLRCTRLPQPVIARVHGIATAAGCQLVAACDLAVCSDESHASPPRASRSACSARRRWWRCRATCRARRPWRCCSPATSSAPRRRGGWGLVNQVAAPDALGRRRRGRCAPTARQAAGRAGAGQARLLPSARARDRGGLRPHHRRDRRQRPGPRIRRRPGGLRRTSASRSGRRPEPRLFSGPCRRSSTVEHPPCKREVGGSSPFAGTNDISGLIDEFAVDCFPEFSFGKHMGSDSAPRLSRQVLERRAESTQSPHRNEAILARFMQLALADLPEFPPPRGVRLSTSSATAW